MNDILKERLPSPQNLGRAACKLKEVPEIHEKSDEVRFGSLTGQVLSFELSLSMKPVKKFFVYKCKLSLSGVALFSLLVHK